MRAFTNSVALIAYSMAVSLVCAAPAVEYPGEMALQPTGDATHIGNYYNYWVKLSTGLWDLTRSAVFPSTFPKTIPIITGQGSNASIIIDTNRTALVIIDMQNFFLYPALETSSVGRDLVPATLNMIHGFRDAGMKVIWTNWGLDDYDLLTIPPSFIHGFSTDGTPATSFGSDMGIIDGIEAGPKLMRGSWNAQPWGPLYDEQVSGVAAGTDLYFNKNRLSGLWGAQTPLGLYLEENQITTLFFGGVNADQCVWGTFLDAFYKGYDVIYVEDITGTTSPYYATEMLLYNGAGDGWLTNSTMMLPALAAQA